MKHYCQGPKCHEYKTQSRIRGMKGAKVLRTRYACAEFQPEHLNWWEDYFCNDSCLYDWLKVHLTHLINYVGLRTEPLETPVDVIKKTFERETYSGNKYTYTDTTIKLLSEQTNNDIATT